MAHELAHHKNRDRRMIVLVENLQAMSRILAVLLAMIAAVHMILGQESVSDLWSAGLAVAVVTFNRFAALPLFMRMLRAHEYAADALGAAATGRRADMAAALVAIDLRAAAAVMLLRATGYDIRDPADDEFRSHPDTADRVRALMRDEDL